MADEVLLEKYSHPFHELFRISSGAMRFKLKGQEANIWLTAREVPSKELFQITIAGPVCQIRNLRSNEQAKVHFHDNIINNVDFTEFWISCFHHKVRFGFAREHLPLLLELFYEDNDNFAYEVGYIKFNTPNTRFSNIAWLIEAPPALNISPLTLRKGFEGNVYWQDMYIQKLPLDAIIGGFENEPSYIIRTNLNRSLCPGRYLLSKHIALLPWGGREHRRQRDFQILCGFGVEWVKTKGNDIPQNAFVAGYSEVLNEPLYIGRAMYDGNLLTGKVHALYKLCYLPYKGREIEVHSYEILVLIDGKRHTIYDEDNL
ncbi:uncharacterized protein LOC135087710 [Ostrinia nubilalis]|uniref:uncharacterized protein LOC135087710 n=1 Tax=Ostrinia nubilalis TaxID=29057 RepID=UPI00308235FA